jgi:FtsP/CotA-like multicopper oxidase with cupredoxin domain
MGISDVNTGSTRRSFMIGGLAVAGAGGAALLSARGSGLAAVERRSEGRLDVRLRTGKTSFPLLGKDKPAVNGWAYNAQVPGPEIRARQGDRLKVLVENGLDEETTIHWHGVRVPNRMDGVPHLTQEPIKSGGTFAYEFDLHDAGTFWYHPHHRSFEQVARGLYAPLIVEEREPITVDRDITWMLDDWRLDSSGQISGGFGSRHDATMAGRIGNTVTINGRLPQPLQVRSGERIRLRLVNAANARIFGLNFEGHRPQIIAIDGQPVRPHEPNGPVVLGPAMRVDLILDTMAEPGTRARVTDDFYEGLEYPLTSIVYAGSRLRRGSLQAPIQLPANPLRQPQLGSAQHHELVFGGGMMGMMSGGGMMSRGGMMGGGMNGMMGWTVNGVSTTGHDHEPILTIPRGRTAVMHLKNQTAWWHPIHVHGHSFRVLARNGKPTTHKEWQDTVLVAPEENVQIAFVADNPGDWMIHCHILEHQAAGMTTAFTVT